MVTEPYNQHLIISCSEDGSGQQQQQQQISATTSTTSSNSSRLRGQHLAQHFTPVLCVAKGFTLLDAGLLHTTKNQAQCCL
jgi:hypothetical protein